MLDEIKKKNDKKFSEFQEKEEIIRRERFYESLEKQKKRQIRETEVQKLLEKNEEDFRLMGEKFDKIDEMRRIKEKKKKEYDESVILEKRLKRGNKEDEIKKIIDENFSNHMKKIEDRQKMVSLRESKMKSFIEEKKMDSYFKSQEKSKQNRIKKNIYERDTENKIETKKKVK